MSSLGSHGITWQLAYLERALRPVRFVHWTKADVFVISVTFPRDKAASVPSFTLAEK